jgi:uncharacterized protein (TIGR00251 family)
MDNKPVTYLIKVIPNAKKSSVDVVNERLKVKVSAPAVDGKANEAVIKVLAQHFKVRTSEVKILKGEKSRDKVVSIG